MEYSKKAKNFSAIMAILVGIAVGIGYAVGFWQFATHLDAATFSGINPAA